MIWGLHRTECVPEMQNEKNTAVLLTIYPERQGLFLQAWVWVRIKVKYVTQVILLTFLWFTILALVFDELIHGIMWLKSSKIWSLSLSPATPLPLFSLFPPSLPVSKLYFNYGWFNAYCYYCAYLKFPKATYLTKNTKPQDGTLGFLFLTQNDTF